MSKLALGLLALSLAACSNQTPGTTSDGGVDAGPDSGAASDGGNDAGPGCAPSCAAGTACVAGACVAARCSQTSDCGAPLACNDAGYCAGSGCTSACAPDQVCVGDVCINDNPCGPHEIVCGTGAASYCADLAQDSNNCGGCGLLCPSGEVCTRSQCATSCLESEAQCANLCTNLEDDSSNCGACNTKCPAGDLCSGGDCAPTCTGRYGTTCGSGPQAYCAELQDDPYNCGGCGTVCGEDLVCSRGFCAATCSGIEDLECGGVCVDEQTDEQSCGACGTHCVSAQVCSGGACATYCAIPFTTCTEGTVSYCANLQEDTVNCGACGDGCLPGQVCSDGSCTYSCTGASGSLCNGLCVHLDTDNQNCGQCGNACGAGQVCNGAGVCAATCEASVATCGSGDSTYCADTASDHGNCGQCGNACAPGAECVDSACGGSVPDGGAPDGGDAGSLDAGTCQVSGQGYAAGTPDPLNGCETCQPAVSGVSFSNADGTACISNGGNVCQGGACVLGCVIQGIAVPPNSLDPSNQCQACLLGTSTSTYSPEPDGQSCTLGGNVCFQGRCQAGCLYNGAVYTTGSLYPANPCQACSPATPADIWPSVPDGTNCSPDAGFTNACQLGICQSDTPATAPAGLWAMPALLGPDSNIYVIGGANYNPSPTTVLPNVSVYSPSTNSWSSGPALIAGTYGHAGAVANGNLYSLGGITTQGVVTGAVEMLNVDGGGWQNISTMPTARSFFGAALGPDGLIYTVGGTTSFDASGVATNDGTPTTTVEAFDPVALTWSTKPSLPTARYGHIVVTGADGLIYAIGGATANGVSSVVEAFDTATQKWVTGLPIMPTARMYLGGAAGSDGLIYAIAGWDGTCGGIGGAAGDISAVETYDPIAQTWGAAPPVPVQRFAFPAAGGIDGRVYVFEGTVACATAGGWGGQTNDVNAYSPALSLWW